MSSRLLYSLTDDKPGMQKQIGCMNGIFQLFDRQTFLSGRRLNGGHSHKRLLAGQNATADAEEDGVSQKSAVKISKATKFERHRFSSDSSRSSVSSSCNSSSFSSLEENRPAKLEPSLLRLTTTQYNQPHDSPLRHLNAAEHLRGQSPDLSDIAKGSSYRESLGVSLRPPTKDKAAILTYVDSPRPLNPSKSVKPKTSYLSDSFGILPNLHQPQTSAEQVEIDSFCSLSKKDAPRFSYDGRESRDALKSNLKLKEQPRHSLDSKRGSMSVSSQSQSRYLQGNHQRVNHSVGQTVNSPRPQGSHARQSSVVAKLMGLEALPDSISNSQLQVGHSRTNSIEAFDPFSVSSRTLDRNKPALLSGSPRKSQRAAISPQEATADSVMQFNPSSQFPIQATTWKRPEGSQSPAVPVPESTASHSKASNATLSVYGEIEKRLAQLEFKKSGKDLRALKQILEAMQKSKETLENKKDVYQASDFMFQTSSCSSGSRSRVAPCGNIKSEAPDSPRIKKISSPKNLQSSIVENLKISGSPVNSTSGLAKLQISPSSRRKSVEQQQTEDLTPRKVSSRQPHFLDRRIGSRNTLPRVAGDHQHVSENTSSCGKSGTSSPRLTVKESRATDAQRTSKLGKQTKEPHSPGGRPRSKTNHVPLISDRANENSSHTRDLSDENNTISLQSAASMESQDDTEVSSVYSFAEIRGQFPPDDPTKKKTVPSREQELSRKPGIPTTEQPSPVSVLDASYFEEETPSPVKMTSGAFKDDEVSGELKWYLQELDNSSDSKKSSFSSAINQNNLVNLPLVQNEIEGISTNQGSGTAFPSESTSSDHAYISEILSASGLLSDLDSGLTTIQLHPSGQLISGNLFHTLEQTKASNISSGDQARERTVHSKRSERMRRKLIFDVVREILVHRVLLDHSRNWFSSDKLGGRKEAQQRLLKGLCSEIDQLQTDHPNRRFDSEDEDMRTILSKDLTHQELNWTGSNDISGLVLDIERLIFKDLISEVVSNLAAGPRPQPTGRHRRQLIFK